MAAVLPLVIPPLPDRARYVCLGGLALLFSASLVYSPTRMMLALGATLRAGTSVFSRRSCPRSLNFKETKPLRPQKRKPLVAQAGVGQMFQPLGAPHRRHRKSPSQAALPGWHRHCFEAGKGTDAMGIFQSCPLVPANPRFK